MGLGIAFMGYLKRVGTSDPEGTRHEARDDAELGGPMQRIRGFLQAPPEREPTVEKMAARLGLPEVTMVRALVRLRDRGEVKEELNSRYWRVVLCTRAAGGGGAA